MMLWKCYAHLGTGPKILVMINGQTHAFGTLMLIYIKNKKKTHATYSSPSPYGTKTKGRRRVLREWIFPGQALGSIHSCRLGRITRRGLHLGWSKRLVDWVFTGGIVKSFYAGIVSWCQKRANSGQFCFIFWLWLLRNLCSEWEWYSEWVELPYSFIVAHYSSCSH